MHVTTVCWGKNKVYSSPYHLIGDNIVGGVEKSGGSSARYSHNSHLSQGAKAALRRLVLAVVVVVRWSNNLNVKHGLFIMFEVLLTSSELLP